MKKQLIVVTILVLAVVATSVAIFAWRQEQMAINNQEATQSATPNPSPTKEDNAKPSASQTPQPVEQSVLLYLVALEDTTNGSIGCGDGLVGVTKQLTTTTPLKDSMQALLAIKDQHYGESGLYNALWQSNLTVESATINNGQATIALAGELRLGGTCDSPRVEEQLKATAKQFASIESVDITLNGKPLNEALSTK